MTKECLDSKLNEDFLKIKKEDVINSLKRLKESVEKVKLRYDIGRIGYPNMWEYLVYLKSLKGVKFFQKVKTFFKSSLHSSNNLVDVPIDKAIKYIDLHFDESVGSHKVLKKDNKYYHWIFLKNYDGKAIVDRMIINYVTN